MSTKRKKRKLHAFDPSLTTPWMPEKMTIPEIQAYLMEYNVPCPKVSKSELLKIFKQKVYPKLRHPKSKRPKTNSSHTPFRLFSRSSSTTPQDTRQTGRKSRAMEVENESGKSGSKNRKSARKLFHFGKITRKSPSKPSIRKSSSYKIDDKGRSGISSSLQNSSGGVKATSKGVADLFGGSGTFPQVVSPISSDRQNYKPGLTGEGGKPTFKSTTPTRGPSIFPSSANRSTLQKPQYFVSAGRARTNTLLDRLNQENQDNSSKEPENSLRVINGNQIQYGQNIFGLGDEVVYRNSLGWKIIGIDFESMSLNIKKENQVKNILPQYLKMIVESQVGKKRDEDTSARTKTAPVHFAGLIPANRMKTTHRGRHFALAIALACIVFVGALAYLLKQPGPNFCDFQKPGLGKPDCTPCPRHATCRNGKAKCWESYNLHWDVCRKTKQLEKYIATIVQTSHTILKEKRGDTECRLGPKESKARIISDASLSKRELKLLVAEKLGLNSTATEGVEYKEHWKFLNAFGLAHIEFSHYFESNSKGNFWYSKESIKTWRCSLKELLHQHSRQLAMIIFASGLGLWVYWRYLCWQKYYYETVPMAGVVKKCAMEILHQAANSSEPVVAIDLLKETILSGEAEGLGEAKPGKVAWDLGYSNLRQDRRVMALMKVLDGRNTPCLKLRANASTGVLGAITPQMGAGAV